MYPIQCPGGYPIPAKKGIWEIKGINIGVQDPTQNSEFAIFDDSDSPKILSSLNNIKQCLCYIQGIANVHSNLFCEFEEPIKTRHGISIYYSNIKPGTVCVYTR